MQNIERQLVDIDALSLPSCASPKPGDTVEFITHSVKLEGEFIGYDSHGRPLIECDHGSIGPAVAPSMEVIIHADNKRCVGPNWQRLHEDARLFLPTDQERSRFDKILDTVFPPGHTYMELLKQFQMRGYETFLVGGTVRDVIAGEDSNDVDFVTSMPMNKAHPLIFNMFGSPRKLPSQSMKNGSIRIGGAPGSGDPFVDCSAFKLDYPGITTPVFGSDICRDAIHRDFACNCIYYDPFQGVLIDPTGYGVSDASNKIIRLVWSPNIQQPTLKAKICIRFFKFLDRGYDASSETEHWVRENLSAALLSMKSQRRASYIKTQVLSKYAKDEHISRIKKYEETILGTDFGGIWQDIMGTDLGEFLT